MEKILRMGSTDASNAAGTSGFMARVSIGDVIAACSAAASVAMLLAGIGMFYGSMRDMQRDFGEFRNETRRSIEAIRQQQITPEASRRIAVLESRDLQHDQQIDDINKMLLELRTGQNQILSELRSRR